MKIRKAFKKLICMTCAALMAVTLIPAPPAKAALPKNYKYTSCLDGANSNREINGGVVATQNIPNTGIHYIGGWVLSTLPIQSYDLLILADGKTINSFRSSTKPKVNVYPYFKQYNWNFGGVEASFGQADGVTYQTKNSGWCFKIDTKDLPVASTAMVFGNITVNGKNETILVASVALRKNVNNLVNYLKAVGKTVKSATSANLLNYFKMQSNDAKYTKYLSQCTMDTSLASSYKNEYEQKKEFYDCVLKYTKDIVPKADANVGLILNTLYIHACFEQMAYGNSNDSVVKGFTDAFDRIGVWAGPFKQIFTNHTMIMKAEYALMKARIEQIKNIDFMKDAYADFTSDMIAEIYKYSLTNDCDDFCLLYVAAKITDINLRKKYFDVLDGKNGSSTKYRNKRIPNKYAERLFFFELAYLEGGEAAAFPLLTK